MAAHPGRVSPLLAFVLGVMAAVIAMLAILAIAGVRAPKPHLFAFDLRLPQTPPVPDTPSLPPPPIPVPN